MKIEKLPSGSYRVRKMINSKTIQVVFDHKPSQTEVLKAISKQADVAPVKGTFHDCANKYIEMKRNVISPSTSHYYEGMLNVLPDSFKKLKASQITQVDIQTFVNDFAKDHKAKTVYNYHGFISAVLKQFRPDMALHTTLPQKVPNEGYIPTKEDIKMILDASKDDPRYHIPFQLGVMGLRRSEICALTLDDIDKKNNLLTVDKAMVIDDNSPTGWTIKTTKTEAGTRQIYIPDNLINEIMSYGKIYDDVPGRLVKALHRYQYKLNLPRFRFHDLRHFFASYAHSQGISDADIIATGGWKTDYTMKKIYRHEMNQKQAQKTIFNDLLS